MTIFQLHLRLQADNLYSDDLIIQCNKSAIIEIPFTGSPQPKVVWKYNNKSLPDFTRITSETIYNMTALTISRSKRTDTGSYSLSLENKHGSATITIRVQVIGKEMNV